MSDKSKIEWTDATWNPIRGCTRVSEGCRNCYAEHVAARFSGPGQPYEGLATRTGKGPRWTGKVAFIEKVLDQPLRWQKPRRIFVNSMSDLFHEDVTGEQIDRIFAVMALAPHHTFQILTKRPERMRAYFCDGRPEAVARGIMDMWIAGSKPVRAVSATNDWPVESIGDIDFPDDITLQQWPLPNVWLGVSVEDQATADERIPHLLETPAAIRFVSAEPLLGPVNLTDIPWPSDRPKFPETDDISDSRCSLRMIEGTRLDWVIVGGESGPGARPMHPDWARSLRDQCAAASVAFYFKQWGEWATVYDRDRDDPDWRRCGEIKRAHPRGRWLNIEGGHGFHNDRVVYVDPVGKRRAGRLLDGVTHDAFPEVRHG